MITIMVNLKSWLRVSVALAACLISTACTGPDHWFGFVYSVDVQQGNVLEQELVNRVERGMSKQEVRDVLGTPLLVDPFHPNLWIYTHSLAQGEDYMQRNLVLHFQDDALVRVEGNVAERTGPLVPQEESQLRAVRVPDPPPEGLLGRLLHILRAEPVRDSGAAGVDTPIDAPAGAGGGPASGEEIIPEGRR